jgi:hypothetical protein
MHIFSKIYYHTKFHTFHYILTVGITDVSKLKGMNMRFNTSAMMFISSVIKIYHLGPKFFFAGGGTDMIIPQK